MKTLMTLPDRFTVDVTTEDIANGIREASSKCPVALALTRAFPPLDGTQWKTSYGIVSLPEQRFTHDAKQFMNAFDWDETVEPITVSCVRELEQT